MGRELKEHFVPQQGADMIFLHLAKKAGQHLMAVPNSTHNIVLGKDSTTGDP